MKPTITKPPTVATDIGMPQNPAAIEVAVAALREQTEAVTGLLGAYTHVGRATADLIRSAGGRPNVASPPPISVQLRRFTTRITEKVVATAALLTEEHRARLGALVPGFTHAALANEPDVIAMVTGWLDLAPDEIAAALTSSLDDLERRFAA